MVSVFMRYPGGKAKAVTFSYDDGVHQDKQLVEIFDKYGMKATFNLNCEFRRKEFFTAEELHEYFLSKGHEIAVHGANHRANGNLRPIEMMGLIGAGNNPMVGMTVAVAVAVQEAMNK